MRKLILMTLGLTILLSIGQARARPSFVSEEIDSDATRLEQNIGDDLGPLGTRLKLPAANVAAHPKDSNAWIAYSRAAIAAGDDEESQKTGTAAAYIAYERAVGKAQQASALAWLGEVFAKRGMWRPALNSYRASLDLAEVAQIRNIYADMREKHGFRILDYKIDNESASPRACFQFSEQLAQGKTDYAPFVTVSGLANAALSIEDQQLCVEGLKHGEHYKIVLREGLPSIVSEIAFANGGL